MRGIFRYEKAPYVWNQHRLHVQKICHKASGGCIVDCAAVEVSFPEDEYQAYGFGKNQRIGVA